MRKLQAYLFSASCYHSVKSPHRKKAQYKKKRALIQKNTTNSVLADTVKWRQAIKIMILTVLNIPAVLRKETEVKYPFLVLYWPLTTSFLPNGYSVQKLNSNMEVQE